MLDTDDNPIVTLTTMRQYQTIFHLLNGKNMDYNQLQFLCKKWSSNKCTQSEMNVYMYILWKTKILQCVILNTDTSYIKHRNHALHIGTLLLYIDLCYWYMSTTKFVKSINSPPYKYSLMLFVLCNLHHTQNVLK